MCSSIAWTTPRDYRFISIEADGTATWGQPTIMRQQPEGFAHSVTFRKTDGTTTSTTGHFYEYGDMPGGFMLVPEPPSGTVEAVLTGSHVGTTLRKAL